jgi:hypothetical protein
MEVLAKVNRIGWRLIYANVVGLRCDDVMLQFCPSGADGDDGWICQRPLLPDVTRVSDFVECAMRESVGVMMPACVLCCLEENVWLGKCETECGVIRQTGQSQSRECSDRVDQENERVGGRLLFVCRVIWKGE